MVHHYRSVKCPNCGKHIEVNHTVDSEDLKGCPFRRCPHCGIVYFDSKYKEPALLAYDEDYKPAPIRAALLATLFGFVTAESFSDLSQQGTIGIIVLAILALIAFVFVVIFFKSLILFIHRSKNYDQYVKDIKKKSADYLEGDVSEEVAESLSRLSNPEYLDMLKQHGVSVPQYFYDRIHTDV